MKEHIQENISYVNNFLEFLDKYFMNQEIAQKEFANIKRILTYLIEQTRKELKEIEYYTATDIIHQTHNRTLHKWSELSQYLTQVLRSLGGRAVTNELPVGTQYETGKISTNPKADDNNIAKLLELYNQVLHHYTFLIEKYFDSRRKLIRDQILSNPELETLRKEVEQKMTIEQMTNRLDKFWEVAAQCEQIRSVDGVAKRVTGIEVK